MREVIAKVTVASTSKSYTCLAPCDRLCTRVLDLVIMLTPGFSHLEILRVRSQYILYGWHSDSFPETAWF
jgi:hypothetical protein